MSWYNFYLLLLFLYLYFLLDNLLETCWQYLSSKVYFTLCVCCLIYWTNNFNRNKENKKYFQVFSVFKKENPSGKSLTRMSNVRQHISARMIWLKFVFNNLCCSFSSRLCVCVCIFTFIQMINYKQPMISQGCIYFREMYNRGWHCRCIYKLVI